jgi:hypothetical protein
VLGHEAFELGAGGCKVPLHGARGCVSVAGADGGDDEFVGVETRFTKELKTEEIDEIEHPGPRILNRFGEQRIAGGSRHCQMKCRICLPGLIDVRCLLQCALRVRHRQKISDAAFGGRQPTGGALNRYPKIRQNENAVGSTEYVVADLLSIDDGLGDDWAAGRTTVDCDVAARLQHAQSLPQSFACHSQLFSKLAFRGKLVASLDSAESNLTP